MADDMKEIAKLRFDISMAEGQLETLNKAFEKFNKTNKTVLNDYVKTQNKITVENLRKNNKIEVQDNNALNKIKVINAKRELEEQKTLNKITVMNEKAALSQGSIWDKMQKAANTYLVTRGLNDLKNAAGELITEMSEVEYTMVEIDRVLNDDSLNIDNYRDKLIKLAYDYGNSFDNVSDVTLRLAQAGFDANESLALTEKTLLALNTAELNATQATEDMVAVMSQWNLMSGDTAKVSADYAKIIDEINITADNFPTTSEDILEALKKTSSAFNLAGASIEETIATIVAAEKASQRGGKAIGTAMNNIVQRLRDTKAMATMEAMGLDIYTDSAKTEFKSIMDILGELSEKMQQLKNEGKENTKEMQNLLSVFTLFRRNVGTALLGEMGDGGTYDQVMELLGENGEGALGYSLQENAKHMATAKAAMEQFNATLLQLKTTVWDGGAEDVFKSLLMLGTDAVKTINTLVDTFGTIPTAIGAATLAFSAFQKQIKFETTDGKISLGGDFIKQIKNARKEIEQVLKPMQNFENSTIELSDSMDDYVSKVGVANISTKGYIGYLTQMKAAQIATQVATVALNAALSLGLSLAISTVISLLDKYIHSAENFRKKQEEIIDKANETINKNNEEIQTVEKLIDAYEKYSKMEGPLTEEQQKDLTASQKEMSEYLIQNNKYTAEMVGNYELQLKTLKEITEEQRTQRREALQQAVDAAKNKQTGLDTGFFYDFFGITSNELQKAGIDISEAFDGMLLPLSHFNDLDFETQLEVLTKWEEQLQTTGQVGTKAYEWVEKALEDLKEQSNDTDKAIANLNSDILNSALEDFLNEHNIQNIEDYKNALESISDVTPPDEYSESVEDFRAALEQMVENTFPQYSDGIEEMLSNSVTVKDNFTELANNIENLSSQFDMVSKAANEFNSYGSITASTFKNIAENDLIQYLDIVNGKMVVNSQYFENAANAAKEKAIADLQERAAAEILNIVTADLNGTLEDTLAAGNDAATGVNVAANEVIIAANKFLQGKAAADQFKASLDRLAGKSIGNISGISETAQKKIANVTKELDREIRMVNSLASGVTKASKSAASGAGSAGRSATKTFEEQSQERVKTFKKEIDDLESLEKSWVNKYKKLELFSTDDLKFITHQRINRYNEYLNQINNLQGISEKDRADLVKEYSAKRQEAELEYFDLLKQKLNEQIKALKEANEERIQGIKDAADAQIDALKKVEDENDKIKQKEEYERKRNELIYGNQGIEYWRQRTGRDAQLALQDAEEKLRDLDQDWEEKKKDWTLDDQIEEIEKARDAQIKAIEDAQQKQIEGWQAAYNEQVRLYAETGQIIYDNSVINAGYLYNAYMDNFVNPLQSKLQNVIASLNTASATASEVAGKMGSGGGGGGSVATVANNIANVQQGPQPVSATGMPTWATIQQRAATAAASSTAKKILSNAKKYLGKFHGGGEVGSSTEALAILRPKEVVLTPEWAAGMNKLVKQINEGNVVGGGNNTNIDVQGNLINMDGVKINDRKDADYLTERIEKVFRDKFNIRK